MVLYCGIFRCRNCKAQPHVAQCVAQLHSNIEGYRLHAVVVHGNRCGNSFECGNVYIGVENVARPADFAAIGNAECLERDNGKFVLHLSFAHCICSNDIHTGFAGVSYVEVSATLKFYIAVSVLVEVGIYACTILNLQVEVEV